MALKARLGRLAASSGGAPPGGTPPRDVVASSAARVAPAAPFGDLAVLPTAHGPVWHRRTHYPLHHAVGHGTLAAAHGADPACLAALDAAPGEAPAPLRPHELLFLDTETTGLHGGAGTVAFLVGLAFFRDDVLVFEQLFLPQLGSERALLSVVAQRMGERRVLCTYNGKSFDWPLLRGRFTMASLGCPAPEGHVDLVRVCRRLLPRTASFRLTAMESQLLGYARCDDLPGALVPETYFRYLAGEGEVGIAKVVRHNEEDILALVALLGRLWPRLDLAGERCLAAHEQFAVARAHARCGRPEQALAVAQAALPLACPEDAVEIGQFCAEALWRGGQGARAVALLEHALRLGASRTPARQKARAHLWLSKRYASLPGQLSKAQVHAERTVPAETPAAQRARVLRLARLSGVPVARPAPGAASVDRVAFVQKDHRARLASAWAPVQKIGLLSAHAKKRVLHPLARNEHVVGKDGNPGAGVAVPGALAPGQIEAP